MTITETMIGGRGSANYEEFGGIRPGDSDQIGRPIAYIPTFVEGYGG